MSPPRKKKPDSNEEIEELRNRLMEAEETLRAIREGEVDAVVVSGAKGEQIFSLVGADSIYRLIVETMKEAAFTLTLDGTILFCNAQFAEFVKRPLEYVAGRSIREFIASDNHGTATFLLNTAPKRPIKQRMVFEAADGTSTAAHVSATMLDQPDGPSICVVASDLTELENSTELIQMLRRQQEALQRANEELAAADEGLRAQNEELFASRTELDRIRARYEDLFETAPGGYVVTDPEGVIQEVNPAAAAFLDRRPADLKGNLFSALLPQAGRGGYRQVMGALAARTAPPKWEVEIRPLAGPGCWASITAAASRDETGRIVGLRWLLHDVTDRKRAEEGLREAVEELRRSNDDLQQFAYVASHDLQEPLRMIGGFLDLLKQKYHAQLDEKAREYIAYSVDGATRMSALIKDLLEYAHVGAKDGLRVPVDLAAVAEVAKANLKGTIEESGAVVTGDPLPTVTADRVQMGQLFQNLLGNALKFRARGRRPEVHIGARQDGGQWVFCVQDNGIGIDPAQTDRLFKLFQRLHARDDYPGTGIGLALCKKIVERHGGRIWVESEPGEGSTFRFTLPTV